MCVCAHACTQVRVRVCGNAHSVRVRVRDPRVCAWGRGQVCVTTVRSKYNPTRERKANSRDIVYVGGQSDELGCVLLKSRAIYLQGNTYNIGHTQ